MSVLSIACCTLFSAVCAFAVLSASGCGTDAKGVDDCRDIEEARCAAAPSCGIAGGVDACKRFYRAQCLHGLAVDPPGSKAIRACVTTINAAVMCVMADPSSSLKACPDLVSTSAPGAKTACDIVASPELAAECAFLVPDADAGTTDGGTGGTGSADVSPGTEDAAGSSGAAGG